MRLNIMSDAELLEVIGVAAEATRCLNEFYGIMLASEYGPRATGLACTMLTKWIIENNVSDERQDMANLTVIRTLLTDTIRVGLDNGDEPEEQGTDAPAG